MIRTVIIMARIDVKLFWMEVEDYINDVLIPPRYFAFVLLIDRNYVLFPTKLPHSSKIHEHHSRIYP